MDQVSKLKVVVCETSPDMRGVLKSIMKNLGIVDCIACASLEEVVPLLKNPESCPDWVVSNLSFEEDMNALRLLRLTLDEPELLETRVSLLLEEAELKHAPVIFELGALSFHTKPISQQDLENELKEILQHRLEHPGMDYMTAARYLKDALAKLERFEDLLRLEERLVKHFPKEPIFMLNLAEAYFLCGDQENAVHALSKARFFGDSIRSKVIEVMSMVAPDLDIKKLEPFAVAFGVKNAYVIDTDSMESRRTKDILANLGIENIEVFDNASKAMESLYSGEFTPDIIIMEWKLREIAGPAFIQRLEAVCTELPPVIVTSAHLKPADHLLLREIGASHVVEKPYRDEEMIRGVLDAIKSTVQPSGLKDLVHKLKEAAYSGDKEAAQEAHAAILALENVPVDIQCTADGLWSYLKKDFVKAKDHVVIAIKESKDSVLLVDLLGKILIHLGQKDAAIKCFMKASHLSPLHLERLCSTAELCSETGNGDDANHMLDTARKVDEESDRVILAESRVALNLGDTEAAQKAVMKMGNLGQLISYMNNRAVTMVHDGDVEGALNLYDDALKALPEDRHSEKAVILFNKGLALARLQKADEAVGVLSSIQESDHADIYKKSQGLAKKIKTLADAGKNISFAKKEESGIEFTDRPTAMHVYPGQLRMHLIYECDETLSDSILKKLNPISFKSQTEKSAS